MGLGLIKSVIATTRAVITSFVNIEFDSSNIADVDILSVTLVHCIHTAEDIVKLLCRRGLAPSF